MLDYIDRKNQADGRHAKAGDGARLQEGQQAKAEDAELVKEGQQRMAEGVLGLSINLYETDLPVFIGYQGKKI
jgi:hypothetical protein